MKIALYARSIDKDLLPELKSFFSSLAEYGFEIYLYQDLLNHLKDKYSYTPPYAQCFSSYKELDRNIDFLIVLGVMEHFSIHYH
jgi:hypothetical protein